MMFLAFFPKAGLYRGWLQLQGDGMVLTSDWRSTTPQNHPSDEQEVPRSVGRPGDRGGPHCSYIKAAKDQKPAKAAAGLRLEDQASREGTGAEGCYFCRVRSASSKRSLIVLPQKNFNISKSSKVNCQF